MIKFQKIKFKNFLSYGEKPTEYDLTLKGSTLIIGNNEDVGEKGSSRNGAGKTTIMQAVIYALFGKGVDKLKADEFINLKNGKKLVVELTFEKNGHEYQIIRKRKPNGLELYVDGESITLDSMANTESKIQEIVGSTYEIFMMVFYMSPNKESFMKMSTGDQRNMIESILSLDTLSKRAESLKKIISNELNVELKLAERDFENAKANSEKQKQDLERLKNKNDEAIEENKRKKENLEEEISILSEIDMDEIDNALKKKEELAETLEELSNQISKIKEEKQENKQNLVKKEHEKNNIDKEIETLKGVSDKFFGWEESQKEKLGNLSKPKESKEELSSVLEWVNEEREKHSRANQLGSDIQTLGRSIDTNDKDILIIDKKLETLSEGVCFECGQPHKDEDKEEALKKEKETLVKEKEKKQIEKDTLLKELNQIVLVDMEELKEVEDQTEDILKNLETYEIKKEQLSSQENPYAEDYKDLENQPDLIESLGKESEQIGDEIDELVKKIENQENEIELIEEHSTKLDTTFEEILEETGVQNQSDLKLLVKNFEDAKTKLNEISSFKSPFEDEVNHIEENLIDVDEYRQKAYEIENDIKHAKYLVKLLTDPKSFVRKNIVDKYIPYLNKKLIERVVEIGLPHVCQINSDLSVDITYMSKNVSYYNLSQGERLRLDLGINLAFRDLMGMLGNTSNIMFVDEYFDGAGDEYLVQKSFNLLSRYCESVMMISHRESFKERVDHVVEVTKSNGFSSYEFI